ncbi:hypothetical protein ACFLV3_01695 [Chloroflexota bacterium]
MTDFQTELGKLNSLKGGLKHLWLTQHRELIIQFHQEFGDEATIETFHIGENTLHNILACDTSEEYDITVIINDYKKRT